MKRLIYTTSLYSIKLVFTTHWNFAEKNAGSAVINYDNHEVWWSKKRNATLGSQEQNSTLCALQYIIYIIWWFYSIANTVKF